MTSTHRVSRLLAVTPVALIALVTAACGGSSSGSGSPTSPSPTASSIQIQLADPILVGRSEQATATASFTNGTSQAITTGFQSDTPSVATVDASGNVTGVANGRANIYVVHAGQQGTKNIRVVPNCIGDWSGSYVVRTSTCTGAFSAAGVCAGGGSFAPNRVLPTNLSLSQTRDVVTGRAFLGTIPSDTFTTNIGADGSIGFSAVARSGDNTLLQTWMLNSTRAGNMTGGFGLIWTIAGVSGELRATMDIRDLNRSSSAGVPAGMMLMHDGGGTVGLEQMARALAGR